MRHNLFSRVSIERLFIAMGLVCLAYYGLSLSYAAAFQRAERAALEQKLTDTSDSAKTTEGPTGMVGLLDVPRLNMSVIVMDGDDDQTLKISAGHLSDTSLPWENGNSVIAAHRDTFFRPLRYLRVGDEIRLISTHGTFGYRVRELRVVEPVDVSVLASTGQPTLTLVTCYPFSYIGPAPRRFIVRAEREDSYNSEKPGGAHAAVSVSASTVSRADLSRAIR